MEVIDAGMITLEAGLAGDHKGARFPKRQITVLAREDWAAALAQLGSSDVPWTVRRANLLVEGVRLPRAKGAVLRIGPVELEVTGQTYPCQEMETAGPGLLKALAPAWRGGVTCRVTAGGAITIGDPVHVVSSPPEHAVRLP